MKFKHSKEFSIGLSIIAALLVVYFGIEYLKGNNVFKPANYYYATYTDVAGLAQSAPVTINGYKVGLVQEIQYEYDNPGHIKVEMSLDKALKLPKGTKAVLVTDMLGTASIELKMANTKDFHNVSDELIAERSPGLMGNVTNNILPTVGEILPKVDSLITSLSNLAASPALMNSLEHLETTLENIETGSARLKIAMERMPSIAGDASAVMSNVKEISVNLDSISSDLTGVSSQLKNIPLQTTMNNIAQTSESIKQLMSKLNGQDSSLGLLINDRELYNNLNSASASLDSLLRDVKKNPKRYISIKLL